MTDTIDGLWPGLLADPDLIGDLDTCPPSPRPDLRELDLGDAVEAIVKWFWDNFEDPAERTPHDEGEYVWIWGGPYDAREQIEEAFGHAASEQAIEEAVKQIETDGDEWAPSGSRIQEEECSDPVILTKRALVASLQQWVIRPHTNNTASFNVHAVAALLQAHCKLRRQLAEELVQS